MIVSATTRVRRVAVVGAGMIGALHHRAAVLAGAHVEGVLASRAGRSADVAARWGVPTAFGSIDEIVDSGVDLVHVASPNATHAPYVRRLLAAGVHVICEKPLGVTRSEAVELADAADAAGVVATVPFVYRFHPMVREVRARAADGEFGRWTLLHGSYLQDWMLSPTASGWRVDPAAGGASRAFADIGSHWCDLVEWVSGERIAAVSAQRSVAFDRRPGPDGTPTAVSTEDSAVALFRTQSGILGSVTVSQVAPGRRNRLWFELDGTTGSAVFDQENPEQVWLGGPEVDRVLSRGHGSGAAEHERLSVLPPGHPQGFAHCMEAFVADTYAAVAGDKPSGLPTFEDGARSAAVVEAMLRSSESQSWTAVEVTS
jgi:predicted dehydrogenase